jgi:hypothetical protein
MARQLNKSITIDNVLGRQRQDPSESKEVGDPAVGRTWERGVADDVYATPAMTANIQEYNALPATQENKGRRTLLRTRILASLRQQYETTRVRRDNRSVSSRVADTGCVDVVVMGRGYSWNPPADAYGDDTGYITETLVGLMTNRMFRRGEGYVLRLLRADGTDKFLHIYHYDPMRMDVPYFFAVEDTSPAVLEQPARNETNFWVMPMNSIPARERGRLEQWYKDSETGSCVADAIIQSVQQEIDKDISVEKNKQLIKSLTKIAKEFPHGMTVEMIQEHIVNKKRMPLTIKHLLPVKSLDIKLTPPATLSKSGKPQTHLKEHIIMNTRPNHVDIYGWSGKPIELTSDEFSALRAKYQDATMPVWIGQIQEQGGCATIDKSIISSEGHFVLKSHESDYNTTFFNQFKNHTSIFNTITQVNQESYMLDFQALQFTSGRKVFVKDATIYEYDQDASYAQYPHADAGYLVYHEDVCISFDEMRKVLETIDFTEFEVLMDITFTDLSPLYKLLQFPIHMVCPSWFFKEYLLPYTQGLVSRYEVRKKFYMNIDEVKEVYCSFYKEEDPVILKKSWKQAYVKLFGLTGRRQIQKAYVLKGVDNVEYIQYLESTLDDPTTKFREYSIDETGKKDYLITTSKPEIEVCPQILNARSLYSLSVNLDIALKYPHSVALITLDSIGLTERIYEPLYKLKLKRHLNSQFPITVPLDYPPSLDYSFLMTPHVPRPTIRKVNYVVGMGGSGKTYTKVHTLNANRISLSSPTKQFRDQCKEDYPHLPHIMTHHIAGKLGITSLQSAYKKEGIFLVDEFTQRTQKELDEIQEFHPESIFFFIGDVCQETGIPYQCYNEHQRGRYHLMNVETEFNDRRSNNEETKELKRGMRKIMTDSFKNPKYHKFLQVDKMIRYISSFIPYADRDSSQNIIISSNWAKSFYTEDDVSGIPSTCHKIQGATIENKFQIDLSTMSLQQIYTAVSRCRDHRNITLIRKADLKSDDPRASYRIGHMDFVNELEVGGILHEEKKQLPKK